MIVAFEFSEQFLLWKIYYMLPQQLTSRKFRLVSFVVLISITCLRSYHTTVGYCENLLSNSILQCTKSSFTCEEKN